MTDVITLTEANFDEEVLASEVPVIVDYWAPWCGPCRMLGPVIEQIADERAATIKVAKVNVDEEPGLADRAGVRGIPFVVLYRDGQPPPRPWVRSPRSRSSERLGSTPRSLQRPASKAESVSPPRASGMAQGGLGAACAPGGADS